jgi:hypothetical protein
MAKTSAPDRQVDGAAASQALLSCHRIRYRHDRVRSLLRVYPTPGASEVATGVAGECSARHPAPQPAPDASPAACRDRAAAATGRATDAGFGGDMACQA